MKKRIAAKTVNGQTVPGYVAVFEWDMFAPDMVTIHFPGANPWMVDRTMLTEGGDFGGDVAITVDDYDTVIGLIDPKTGVVSPVVFDTLFIREFISDSSLGVDIPHMRECQVDNFIVQFQEWNDGLVA